MINFQCNWCGEGFLNQDTRSTLVYTIILLDPATGNQCGSVNAHLHFKCLEFWICYMQGGPEPVWMKVKKDEVSSA